VGLGAVNRFGGPRDSGQFIYHHEAEPRFAATRRCLAHLADRSRGCIDRQMVMAQQIGHDQPVAAMQKQLESLRMLRIRVTKWGLLTGQLVGGYRF